MINRKFIDWFKDQLEDKLTPNYSLKYLKGKGDFGELSGVQFDSDKKGGHIYFWSLGFYNFHLYDFEKDEDIIPDTHGKILDFDNLLKEIIEKM